MPKLDKSAKARLTQLREDASMSLYDVAEKVGKSHTTIHRYESDPKAGIKTDMLQELARVYKTTVAFILTGVHPDSTVTVPKADYIELPFFTRTAYGSFAVNCLDHLPDEYNTMWVLKREGRDYKDARILEIRGNSMAPKYGDRVCVAVRPVQEGDWQYATGVHAISLRNAMFIIKRITSNQNGVMELTSDSSGEKMNIELGDILCMWKVGEKVYEPAED
ncbi:helix-turn-helix domain-containing protein [Hymenobacter tenuis]